MPRGFFKILLPAIFFSGVFGYDFSHCITYYNQATIPTQNSRSVSIKTSKGPLEIVFSPTLPQGLKILKSDPFVGLYIVQGKKPHYSYQFKNIDSYAKNRELSAIALRYSKKGKILAYQKGFIDYAEFSSPIPRNGVISNICYQIYGLGVGGRYFIDKKYLDRFLSEKSAYYGDIGVRVIQKDKYILVRQVDPFFQDNPFLSGDVILSINGKNINSYGDFEWTLSNLPYKKPAQIEILRNTQKQKLNVVVDKRYGGFLLPDTFLERFGIVLDKTLTITDIDENSKEKLNLKIGDQIIWINDKPVLKNTDDSTQKANDSLRSALTQAGLNKNMEILIMRSGLELRLKLQEE
ncbi:DUF7488 domain-containing protein [Helicobacter cappadocius]|uniref:PDZ domain-containing protein n=1 Tax=Helicobacter cappadocius TaxID=3063998 RepID=A0AA90PQU3_9HELI|nr:MULTISPECIES: PDZ domain-containing protein [unclassified Helicobacter]MDO7252555.1 PDZ domain-containing protein [Helicobacter sp. faydin-H75]MDP2538422.1 PDZ domain-containing protein [Helicobacter sp. faydin-H76]